MTIRAIFIVFAACLPLLAVIVACTPPETRIEGRVFRSDTNIGIQDVRVDLRKTGLSKDDPPTVTSTSSPQGQFTLAKLEPGDYSLLVSASFQSEEQLPCIPAGGGSLAKARGRYLAAVAVTRDDRFVEIVTPENLSLASREQRTLDIDLSC